VLVDRIEKKAGKWRKMLDCIYTDRIY